jgi:hypothetical protein
MKFAIHFHSVPLPLSQYAFMVHMHVGRVKMELNQNEYLHGMLLSKLPQAVMLQFLGTYTKLQKATISFVMSACLSVHPHGTTFIPLDRFS